MNCRICKREMSISEGLAEIDGKRCHVSCKKQVEKEWRAKKGLDSF
ncbi:MAG: hypothetical protein ACE5DT_06820 [Nitrosopumilus sp.]